VKHRWLPEDCEVCPEGLEADSLPLLAVVQPLPAFVSQQDRLPSKKRRSSAGEFSVLSSI